MMDHVDISVHPHDIDNPKVIRSAVIDKLNLSTEEADSLFIKVDRKSLDARPKMPMYRLKVLIADDKNKISDDLSHVDRFTDVSSQPEIHIIGAGPAGYFAALECINSGLKPIVIDRGKDVQARRRDLRNIQQHGIVNPDSNYCFGEGGAGTYSDGKLYTRSHKRGNIQKSLELLVEHGSHPDILIDAHPHIGSNKLPKIIANIRETIEKYGGEIHFDSKVTDLEFNGSKLTSVEVNGNLKIKVGHVILATGHSARDIYHLLHQKNVLIEAKPYALGVRIEHPQPFVDKTQYGVSREKYNLPASSYKLVTQVENRGVFSFCMCPGGLVVPSATSPGEIVVNGMSLSRRDSPYANSGVVVEVNEEDMKPYAQHGPLAGMYFQAEVEKNMFDAGDGSQQAPSQRVTDFVKGKVSQSLPDTSYIPGIFSAAVHELLPKQLSFRLQKAMIDFDKKMKGYHSEEAIAIGVESRTSSPVRVPRDKDTYAHVEIKNMYPCAEGAGYAGGILSAAMDGENVVKAIKKFHYE